jgi:hypothetical protein
MLACFVKQEAYFVNGVIWDDTALLLGKQLGTDLRLFDGHLAASFFGVECQIILSQINEMSISDI